MKPQRKNPAINLPESNGKTNMRIIKSSENKKKNPRPTHNDVQFNFWFNGRRFETLLKKTIRSTIIEELNIVMNQNAIQGKQLTLNATDNPPVLNLNNYRALTAKEIEVMDLVLLKLSNRKIAFRLKMKFNTAKTHMKNIISKLGVSDRKEACVAYRRLYNKPESS